MSSSIRKSPNIVSLALPMIVGNLLSSIVGFASIKAVGGLGLDAVAAVIAGERALLALQCALVIVTGATTALVAQHWGAGLRDGAAQSVKTSISAMVVVSLALTAVTAVFAGPIISLFGLEGAVAADAATFLIAVSLFNLPYGISQVMAASLRAVGDAYTPLWIFGLANILNIGLLFAFIYGLGPIPSLGVLGAGLANGLAFTFAAVALLGLWLAGRVAVAPKAGGYLSVELLRPMFKVGLPAAGEQLLFQLGLFVMMFIVAHFGTAAVTAYGVGVNLVSFSFVFGTGFAVASSTLVGQAIGAGDPALARKSAWRAGFYALICMTALGLVIYASGPAIGRFLRLDREVQEILMIFLAVLAIVQPLMALEFSLSGALRGAGDTRTSMMIMFAGLFAGRLLFAVTIYLMGFGLTWVFGALIADYGLKALLYVARLRSDGWVKPIIAPPSPASA